MKHINKYQICIIILITLLSFMPSVVSAESMSNPNFKLDLGISPIPTTPSKSQLKQVVPQKHSISILQFPSIVKATMSTDPIDFGVLNPTSPIIRSQTITLGSSENTRFQIHVFEDRVLTATNSASFIPDTTCDAGDCSEQKAGTWRNILSFGLGQRCDTQLYCADDFLLPETFRQLSNASASESASTIAQGKSEKADLKITYKLNIPGTQEPTAYRNTITVLVSGRL